MAAGRHGGYRDNEFRDREMDLGMSRKEIRYLKGDYKRIRKDDSDRGVGQSRVCDSRDFRRRVRQKDIKEWEAMNGGYHSTSTRSQLGSGAVRRYEVAVRTMDREPGELSSDGSDGAIDSEMQSNKEFEAKKLENGNHFSPLEIKKRRFSPIVWDVDDREVSQPVKNMNVMETTNLPPPPPLPKSYSQSPKCSPDGALEISPRDDNKIQILEASSPKIDSVPEESEFPVENSSPPPEEQERPQSNDQGAGALDNEDYVPTRIIISSRWANDADSPADEGEISENEDIRRVKMRKYDSETAEGRGHRKSVSPMLGEVKREGSEPTRGRSFGSDERIRSSSRDGYPESDGKNDYMEIDEDHNYDGTSVSQSDRESEDEHGSHGTPEPALHPLIHKEL